MGTLLLCEVALRLVIATPVMLERLETMGGHGTRVAQLTKAAAEQSIGDTAASYPVVFTPDTGWTNRDGVHEHPTTHALATVIDGFRAPHRSGADDDQVVLVLGDSFVFGEEVGDREHLCALLDARSQGVRFVNAGVPGFGHDQMLLHLDKIIDDVQPDVVLVGFLAIDMPRNTGSFTQWAKPLFRMENGELSADPVLPPDSDTLVRRHRWRPRLLDFSLIVAEHFAPADSALRRQHEMTVALLDRIAQRARDSGARPAFFAGPESPALEPAGHSFEAACQRAQVPCTDATASMAASPDALFADTHWNANGHALVAQHVADWLEAEDLVAGLWPESRPARSDDDDQVDGEKTPGP